MCSRATCAALKALESNWNTSFVLIWNFSLLTLSFSCCRKAAAMVDAGTMEKMEAGFAKLAASDSKSLLKKYLTREVFDALKNKKTSFGSTLLDCVQSGT